MTEICENCEALGERLRQDVPPDALAVLTISLAKFAAQYGADPEVQKDVPPVAVAKAMRLLLLVTPEDSRSLAIATFAKHGVEVTLLPCKDSFYGGRVH